MAWVERTFEEVEAPEDTESEDNVHLAQMLRNLPPYMKITTRRARKALERYETMKQRHVENLRRNPLYKFVMQVAAFTNEDITKYWKGKSVTSMEDQVPDKITISAEELTNLGKRAEANAMADLHQFCRRILAVPMYRPKYRDKQAPVSGQIDGMSPEQNRKNQTNTFQTPGPNKPIADSPGGTGGGKKVSYADEHSTNSTKYIYNMTDTEFEEFYDIYLRTINDYSSSMQPYFILSKGTKEEPAEDTINIAGILNPPTKEDITIAGRTLENPFLAMNHDTSDERDKIFDESKKRSDDTTKYDDENAYMSLERMASIWAPQEPIVRWDANYAQFWFQRYVARWLVDKPTGESKEQNDESKESDDISNFRSKYRMMFNNITYTNGKFYRDLTGMRLCKQDKDKNIVPLDFVKPLYEQRVEWWRHELVLGEYEKRSMYQADQWLQKTPWALGKMYIEPALYGHMIEAHIAVTSRFKKFQHMSVEDLVSDEKHSFFMSKLVAMCIRTSAILSGKKYGLDKMYMRVNLEKKRLMYAWSKLEPPKRRRARLPGIVYGGEILRSPSGRSGV